MPLRERFKHIFHKAPNASAIGQVEQKDAGEEGAIGSTASSAVRDQLRSEYHKDSLDRQVVSGDISKTELGHQSLWDRAYEALDPQLVKKYLNLLSRELSQKSLPPEGSKDGTPDGYDSLDEADNRIHDASFLDRRAQLEMIIKSGLQRMDDQRTEYQIAGHKFVLRDQIAQAANLVQNVKDVISSAVSASPQASLAWAGICVILPILTNPSAAEQANRDGFTYVTARMRYYAALEPLFWPQEHKQERRYVGVDFEEVKREFEGLVVDLYQHILDFQLRSVVRFYRSWRRNFPRDVIRSEKWEDMLRKIKELEHIVDDKSKGITGLISRSHLEEISAMTQGSFDGLQKVLSVAEQQLELAKKQQVLSSQQLQVQVQIAKKIFSQEEEKCHQLFRLARSEKDNSYEWYKNRVEDRVEGTCQWFLTQSPFKIWLEQDTGLLLVSADPGCGKSVLAKYLIDHQLPRLSATICYFFFKDQDQDTLRQATCALLHQLFCQKPYLIRHAMPKYKTDGHNLVNVTSSLWNILRNAVKDPETGPVIFVLDALDECQTPDLRDLILMLKDQSSPEKGGTSKVKFLLTSRPYAHIMSEFQLLVDAYPYIHIPGENESDSISQEVNHVINYRINRLAKDKELTAEVTDYLKQRLLGVPHRTYLWVYLVFDYLNTQHFRKTIMGIESTINTLPKSVNQAYEKILNKSKGDSMVRKVLCIILVAYRPLTLEEMNIAINVDISSASSKELDLETKEDFKMTLRVWCGLFISIHDDKVYFIHQTAREFLLQHGVSHANDPNQSWQGSISMQQGHAVLALSSIIYLDAIASPNDPDDTFVDYSASYWAAHFRNAGGLVDLQLQPVVLRICDPQSKKCQFYFNIYWYTAGYWNPPKVVSALWIASLFGLDGTVEWLLNLERINANCEDINGKTPLSYAAEYGHDKVVKLLLDTGKVDVDLKDSEYGRTPLSWAAGNGHERVVELLLSTRKVDVNSKDSQYDQTPLLWAAANGHDKVVTLLLYTKKVDVNSKSCDGRSPLSHAAQKGYKTVVRLLLDAKKVELNSRSSKGRTPLLYAAKYGHHEVIKLLLDTGKADVDSKDSKYGRTPLSYAAENSHYQVIKLLLDSKKVDVNSKDSEYGRTPLSYAARNGRDEVVKLLLDTGKVDVDSKDSKYGQTPLSYAAECGYDEVVKLLLDTGKVDVDSKDSKYGRTPLSYAAEYGHDEVVKLLLDTEKLDVDSAKSNGRTPLSYAAKNGHYKVVELLLNTGKVNVDSRNSKGRTPLSFAAEYGHDEVVKLLLGTGNVDVNLKNLLSGRTSLSYAAEKGHENVVKMLIDTKKADLNSKPLNGRTPLFYAAGRGHDKVVKLLLQTGEANIDSKDAEYGQTPLLRAAKYGHKKVIKLLLDTGKADVNVKDSEHGRTPLAWAIRNSRMTVIELLLEIGKADVDLTDSENDLTPLSWAAENGHERVVELLLSTGKVDVNLEDSKYGRTPLSYAAEYGYDKVVKLLLDTGKADVDSKDSEYGRTPLSYAARNGRDEAVKLLLDTEKVDVDLKDSEYGRTPLSWAAENGHERVVELLLGTGKVDVNLEDSKYGRTPLLYAARNGRDKVVKLLLDTGKVDVDSKDSKYGQTSLSYAAEYGYDKVVKLLLDTGKVDVNVKDSKYGRTPLSYAVGNGRYRVLKLLLGTGKVDMDSRSSSDRTPLSYAAEYGYDRMVKLLLDSGKVDVDSKDSEYGRTPLSWAAKNGHERVVELLLGTGKADMDSNEL